MAGSACDGPHGDRDHGARAGSEAADSADGDDQRSAPEGPGDDGARATGIADGIAADTEPPPQSAGARRTPSAPRRADRPLAIVATCAPPPPAPASTDGITTLTVATQSREEPLRADVLVPTGATDPPLVVLIHGGGWRLGSREHLRGTMATLATLGYASASLDYRLVRRPPSPRSANQRRPAAAGANPFPAAIADLRCALRALTSHADSLGYAAEHVVVVGFSAGAHLAALLGTAPEVAALDDGSCTEASAAPQVVAVAAFFGPYDLTETAPYHLPRARELTLDFLGMAPGQRPTAAAAEVARLASPLSHVTADDASFLLIHGATDRTVPLAQSEVMHRALSQAQVPSTLVVLPDEGHGFGAFGRSPSRLPATCTFLAFLAEHLATANP